MDIILASASPRRSALLRDMGIKDFKVIPSSSEISPPAGVTPEEAVKLIALGKAEDVYDKTCGEGVIIAADTLVYLDGTALGKPADRDDAVRMLKALSGRSHIVCTGIAVINGSKRAVKAESTRVFFREMTDREIEWYVSTGEPMDKAGAYGIQGLGAVFIPRIEGDYYNVMGLPVCLLSSVLDDMGVFAMS